MTRTVDSSAASTFRTTPTPNEPASTSTRGQAAQRGQNKAAPEKMKTRKVSNIHKPPPINILLQDPKETIQLIKQNNSEADFHVKRIIKTKHVL